MLALEPITQLNKNKMFKSLKAAASSLVLLFFFGNLAFAQDTDDEQGDCGISTNKKALKAYKNGIDKKNNKSERIGYLMEAVELDPDFAAAHWKLADIRIKDARSKGGDFNKAEKNLNIVIDQCPSYHASAYFYMAEIAMLKKEFELASEMYMKFIQFESDDNKKFDKRHDEQLAVARANFPLSSFYANEFKNPKPFDVKKVLPVSTNEADEYLPFISPDNELLLFTRRVELKQNTRGSYIQSDRIDYEERFSYADIRSNSFNEGFAFPDPFNTEKESNYGGACLSIDNKEMFLTICKPNASGKMNCDIYTSRKTFGVNPATKLQEWHWTKLENLGPNVNTEEGWEAQPTLSRDGKMLLFASLREGSKGIDIYYSKRMPDGTWAKAENVGEPINTDRHEKTPFFHSDSRTLYFASQGHMNFGGYDVFYSKYSDDGKWSKPVNLGHPINTEDDEHGYVVSTDGKSVYYSGKSKTENNKKIHIYRFELYEEARPDRVMVMKGNVAADNGKPPKGAEVQVRNSKSNKVDKFTVNEVDGSYTAIVTMPDTADLIVNIKGKDIAFNTFKVDAQDTAVFKKLEMKVEEAKVGKPYRIDNINFRVNSADLTPDSKSTLDAFADYLNENSSIRISIEGHTDNVGDAKANLALSTERAFSVLAYMQSKSVHKDRLQFKGWGAQKPIASNANPEGRAKNRRTEFIILSK